MMYDVLTLSKTWPTDTWNLVSKVLSESEGHLEHRQAHIFMYFLAAFSELRGSKDNI